MKQIILRSGSPRRKELLERENYQFSIIASDIDETMNEEISPYENVKALGLKKAQHEQEKYYGDILIGCDTIVVFNDVIYGKPQSEEDAFFMLKTLSGHTHQVLSGVGIVYKEHIFNFVCNSSVAYTHLKMPTILRV